jgi:hypothetical protein
MIKGKGKIKGQQRWERGKEKKTWLGRGEVHWTRWGESGKTGWVHWWVLGHFGPLQYYCLLEVGHFMWGNARGCGHYRNKGLWKVELRGTWFWKCPQPRALHYGIDRFLLFFFFPMISGGHLSDTCRVSRGKWKLTCAFRKVKCLCLLAFCFSKYPASFDAL